MDDGRLIHRAILATIVVVTCSHCGGGGGGGGSGHIVPPEATMAQTTVKTQMTKFTPFMAGAESSLLLITIEGILHQHVTSQARYRELLGRDLGDAELRRAVKSHLAAAIGAIVAGSGMIEAAVRGAGRRTDSAR